MLRLILALVLFLLSLLTVFKAPTNFLWKVAVAVTEFPYVPIIITSAFLILFFKASVMRVPTLIITLAALLLFSWPVVGAYMKSNELKEKFAAVFPFKTYEGQMQNGFSFKKMFTGNSAEEITPDVLVYKQVRKDLEIDYYRAATKDRVPCVIVIHGGSWKEGDSKQLPELNSYLVKQGFNVAAINYRLAPLYRFPAPIEDTKDALNYLTKHAEELHIDTNNFVLLGRSAGGQIALLSAYTFNDARIKGVISYYAPADMAWGATIKTNKWVLDVDGVFTDYLGGLIGEIPDVYEKATARNYVTPNSPPTLLIHGPNDALVSYHHSVRLEQELEQKKVPYYFLSLPWATHGCDYSLNGPSGQLSTYAVERFISSVTKQ